jgi:S1-C subfamily serine protease
MLTDTFANIRRSIVAFASLAVLTKPGHKPSFPSLIGTGFVIDTRGIVATNRHVVRALEKLPNNPETGASAAVALTFSEVQPDEGGRSLLVVPITLRRWDRLKTFTSSEHFYGEQIPDIAFAQINVSGLPAASLVTDSDSWNVGTPIATAGFPLGTDALEIYGRLNQVAPILRSGIMASVFPFPCPRPHGFTIDIMTLGGESGSPIFLTDSPNVVGLLHAGFPGTNITLAIPSWLVAEAFDNYMRSVALDFNGVPPFDEVAHASDNAIAADAEQIAGPERG